MSIWVRFSYRTDLFEKESLKNFARSYERAAQKFMHKESFELVNITSEQQLAELDCFLVAPSEGMVPENIVSLLPERLPQNTSIRHAPHFILKCIEDAQKITCDLD